MGLAQQGQDHVGILQVLVIARAIQISRHNRQIAGPVLAVVRPAQLDPGDLGHGIRPIRGFQGPGQEVFLLDGLGTLTWVDAGGTQKQQVIDPGTPGLVDHIRLDGQVLLDEFRRVAVVGDNPAHLGGGQKHIIRFLGLEKRPYGLLLGQIQLGMGPGDDIHTSPLHQLAHQGRTDQTTMADIDFTLDVHDDYLMFHNQLNLFDS